MRGASLVGVLALTAVLAGCSAPAPVPGGSDSAPTAAAGAPSSSPTATQSPTAADFAVPSTCDGLLPPELAASFASQGLTGSEVAVFGDVAVGDPIPVLDYDTNVDSGIVMADYLFCEWTGSDQTIDIFLGRVDATSRPLVVSEFWSFDRRIDRTAATVVMTFDGARAATTAQDFINHDLISRLGISGISVGYDFHFGKGRSGSPSLLVAEAPRLGIEVHVQPHVDILDRPVSSTAIRTRRRARNSRSSPPSSMRQNQYSDASGSEPRTLLLRALIRL